MITRTALAATAALALALPSTAGAIDFVGMTPGYSAPIVATEASLVPEDVNHALDYYARIGGQPKLLTSGTGAEDSQHLFRTTADGSISFFRTSDALVPEDTDATDDLYVRRPSGISIVAPEATSPVSVVDLSPSPGIVWLRTKSALLPADTDAAVDLYAYGLAGDSLELATPGTAEDVLFDQAFNGVAIFSTTEAVVATDTDAQRDVYFGSNGGTVGILSKGNEQRTAYFQAIEESNGDILFWTTEKLAAGDTDEKSDLYETVNGGVKLRTPSPNAAAKAQDVYFVAASKADMHRVLFKTAERLDAADTDDEMDFYAEDNGVLTLLTPGTTSTVDVVFWDVSEDAEVMLFSAKEQLLPSDTDDRMDMYRTGDAGLVHVSKTNGPYDEFSGALSFNGVLTAWQTAEPISALDTDTVTDAYIRSKFGTELASRRHAAATGGGTDHHAEVRDFLGTSELIIETPERLLADDRNDTSDVYSILPSSVVMITGDASAPDTLVSAPAQVLPDAPLEVDVSATEQAKVKCRLDGGDWESCDHGWKLAGLAAGTHTIEAVATDANQNADPSPAVATVIAAAPQQTQTEKPPVTETVKPPVTVEPPFPPVAGDKTAPALSAAKVRVRRRVPALTYSLSEAATVRVTVQRRAGRGWKTLRVKSLPGRPGANRGALGKLPRRGTFRFALIATDAARNASARLVLRPKGR